MPLFNIKSILLDTINLTDEARLRRMWTLVMKHCNEYLMENGKYPTIFASIITTEILEQSFLFVHKNTNYINYINHTEKEEYLGNFQNFNVFLSKELIDDEYFIGTEKEMKIIKRKYKLNKIINKL